MGLYQCDSLIDQIAHALVEVAEAFVVRLAAMEPHVDLLQDHRQFEDREDLVIRDVARYRGRSARHNNRPLPFA